MEDRTPQAAGPDADRVRAALAGDPAAFGDLYDRYARVIRAVCHDATGNLAEAQDLSQEVFLRAYRNLATLRDAERFAGWLVGMTWALACWTVERRIEQRAGLRREQQERPRA